MSGQSEPGGDLGHVVAMAHPGDALCGQAAEQGRADVVIGLGLAVFPCRVCLGRGHPAAQMVRQQLAAIADAQHRDPQGEYCGVYLGRVGFVYAARPAGENDADRGKLADLLRCHGVGVDLTVHIAFPDPPGDQLVVLSAKIQDQYFFHRLFLLAWVRLSCGTQ